MRPFLQGLLLFGILVQASLVSASDFPNISLEKALQRGSSEGKNVLVYISAKWCIPCRNMDRNVFPDPALKAELDKHYVSVEVDGDSWRGDKITKEFKVTGFPTILILSPDKRMLRRAEGGMDITTFMAFISNSATKRGLTDSVFQSARSSRDASKKPETAIEFGIRLGGNSAQVTNLTGSRDIGYEVGIFAALESKRFLLRPGLSLVEKGTKSLSLRYLQIPVELGLNFYRGSILNLPGAYRLLISPYAGLLLNNKGGDIENTDYGFRYGAGAFIGEKPRLELILSSELGLKDIDMRVPGKQSNRMINFQVAFTL